LNIDPTVPLLIYKYYNLSPTWRKDERANRILLLEPAIFEQYSVSDQCINLMIGLSKNIKGIQVVVSSFDALKEAVGTAAIHYREHPLNTHYVGVENKRNWIVGDDQKLLGSFFSFWKKSEKGIIKKYFGK